MAYQNSTVPFEKMLMKFVLDEEPMLSMLKWLCERLMEAEVEGKLGAKKYADWLMNEYEGKYPQAIATLEEGLEESLQFFNFRQIDARKIASTNLLERLNREIRRRTKVVGIFPSMDSYIRLVTSYLIEYSEDWSSGRSYINPMLINEIQQQLSKSA